jgi:hypothetical protein
MNNIKNCVAILFAAVLLMITASSSTKAPKSVAEARTFALFFACTDFKDKSWIKLPSTEQEVKLLRAELEGQYGVICPPIIKNPQTPEEITDMIESYSKEVALKPEDRLLVFISSHGYYNSDTKRGYIIPTNGVYDAEHSKTWLSYEDLGTTLILSKSKHVLLMIDACYSGAFLDRFKNKPEEADYNQSEDCQTKISNADKYKSRLACTSGNSLARTPATSKFASKFLELLRSNEIVTMKDLRRAFFEVENPMPESGTFEGHESGGDFIFVPKNACGITTTEPKQPKNDPDLKAIEIARKNPTEENWQEYLDNWKTGRYRPEAETALYNTQEDRVWKAADTKKTEAAYKNYIAIYCPGGRYCTQATEKLKTPPPPPMPDDGLVFVKGGEYDMGCTSEQQDCQGNEKPAHKVKVSDFYIGRFEVTQKEWVAIMGDNPSNFKDCDNCPVEQVSWDDIQTFLSKLNTKYPNRNYRLPTEAEWEFAARGGGKAVLFGNGKNTLDPKEANFNASKDYKKPYSVTGE